MRLCRYEAAPPIPAVRVSKPTFPANQWIKVLRLQLVPRRPAPRRGPSRRIAALFTGHRRSALRPVAGRGQVGGAQGQQRGFEGAGTVAAFVSREDYYLARRVSVCRGEPPHGSAAGGEQGRVSFATSNVRSSAAAPLSLKVVIVISRISSSDLELHHGGRFGLVREPLLLRRLMCSAAAPQIHNRNYPIWYRLLYDPRSAPREAVELRLSGEFVEPMADLIWLEL